jgi:hypothetical protein
LVLVCFVDLEKSRKEQEVFLEREEMAKMALRRKDDEESETGIV